MAYLWELGICQRLLQLQVRRTLQPLDNLTVRGNRAAFIIGLKLRESTNFLWTAFLHGVGLGRLVHVELGTTLQDPSCAPAKIAVYAVS